jgi:hypothetical protein
MRCHRSLAFSCLRSTPQRILREGDADGKLWVNIHIRHRGSAPIQHCCCACLCGTMHRERTPRALSMSISLHVPRTASGYIPEDGWW